MSKYRSQTSIPKTLSIRDHNLLCDTFLQILDQGNRVGGGLEGPDGFLELGLEELFAGLDIVAVGLNVLVAS